MKKMFLMALVSLAAVVVSAQEKIRVELTDGSTAEYEVRKVKRMYFEGKDIALTTGAASNITENGATIAYTVANASGSVSAGIILSTYSDVNYENKQREVLKSSSNGSNSVNIDGLAPSTTYYYKAFATDGGERYYGTERSFTTAAHVEQILFREPYTQWGATKSQTKTYMSAYTLYSEADDQLIYDGKNSEFIIGYIFEGGALESAIVRFEATSTTLDAIDAQLKKDGYYSLGSAEDGTPLYSDGTTFVYVLTNTELGMYDIWYSALPEEDPTPFEEPYINWNASLALVKATMSSRGYTIMDSSDSRLAYYGKFNEMFSIYSFDNGVLAQIQIALFSSDVSVTAARDYLSSELGYSYLGASDDNSSFLYLTSDQTTVVIVESQIVNNTELTVVYYISLERFTSGVKGQSRAKRKGYDIFTWAKESTTGSSILAKLKDMSLEHLYQARKAHINSYEFDHNK